MGGEKFGGSDLLPQPVVMDVRYPAFFELAIKAAEQEGLVGDSVLLNRQSDFEWVNSATVGVRAEALTQPTRTSEDINDRDGRQTLHRCCQLIRLPPTGQGGGNVQWMIG